MFIRPEDLTDDEILAGEYDEAIRVGIAHFKKYPERAPYSLQDKSPRQDAIIAGFSYARKIAKYRKALWYYDMEEQPPIIIDDDAEVIATTVI